MSLIDLSSSSGYYVDRNAAGARAVEINLTHTHTILTHASRAVDTEEALDTRGNAKGETAGKRLGLRKVSLNVLRRVRTQPNQKPTKTTTNTKHSLSKTNSN